MTMTTFVLILCSYSGSAGSFCLSREYLKLDECKAFLASAEAATDRRGMKPMEGVCVPETRAIK